MTKNLHSVLCFIFGGTAVFIISSCGVKGPPLPPIPTTPQRSEAYSPSPSPTSTVKSEPGKPEAEESEPEKSKKEEQ